jgi:putative nucleotidyltransferase with HDIG domain
MPARIREISDKPAGTEPRLAKDTLSIELEIMKEFSLRKERYFQLSRNTLVEDTTVDFNVFRGRGRLFELAIKADPQFPVILDNMKLAKIKEVDREILIERAAIPRYLAYLDSLIREERTSTDAFTTRRATLLKENSKILVKDLLDNPDSKEKIEEIKTSVVAIIDILFENVDMIRNMMSLSQYDYYTYTHSVDVAVLSAGLGVAIGLSKNEVLNLGIGAMLHDIGKSAISPELLNKQGKLNDREYRMIQHHVEAGVSILRRHRAIPESSYDAVAQHHEKLSGSGYPHGLRGAEITLFGRITGIADCYDALTTNRVYKRALKPFDALHMISKERKDYDSELFQSLVTMLGRGRTVT